MQREEAEAGHERERDQEQPRVATPPGRGADGVAEPERDQGGREHEPEVRHVALPAVVDARGEEEEREQHQRRERERDAEPDQHRPFVARCGPLRQGGHIGVVTSKANWWQCRSARLKHGRESRREAAPAAAVVLLVIVVLAVVSRAKDWELLGLSWWIWLLVALPVLLLTIDLALTYRGKGLVRSRRAALFLLGLLALGNFTAVAVLVAGLVTANSADLSGGELLFTGFAIWSADVIVFGLWFWEVDAGGPVARLHAPRPATRDFEFPQDDNPRLAAPGLASASLGLPVRVADELDRLQPNGRDAALPSREGADGLRVGNLRRHRAAHCRARGQRARLVNPLEHASGDDGARRGGRRLVARGRPGDPLAGDA